MVQNFIFMKNIFIRIQSMLLHNKLLIRPSSTCEQTMPLRALCLQNNRCHIKIDKMYYFIEYYVKQQYTIIRSRWTDDICCRISLVGDGSGPRRRRETYALQWTFSFTDDDYTRLFRTYLGARLLPSHSGFYIFFHTKVNRFTTSLQPSNTRNLCSKYSK